MAEASTKPMPVEIEGTVGTVAGYGHRKYVIVNVTNQEWLESRDPVVTFTLTDWKGTRKPRHGQAVIMTGMEQFKKGWRAQSARPIPA